jgi:hypothetical protein
MPDEAQLKPRRDKSCLTRQASAAMLEAMHDCSPLAHQQRNSYSHVHINPDFLELAVAYFERRHGGVVS